jgi:hypothetical protein
MRQTTPEREDFMRRFALCALMMSVLLLAGVGPARAEVCVAIDEARDTFPAADRAAAILLVSRQFELAGEQVAPEGCSTRYTLSHVRLGNTILVTLAGPGGHRDGTALGMDDLPALYSQMVRSIVTGRPMTGFNVIDRTNVTAAQASVHRVEADSLWYARLGYGSVFGDRAYGGPAIGFGYRHELDAFGVDVSFLNVQSKQSEPYSYYTPSTGAFSGSLLKLEGLYFVNRTANATPYAGGGLSWGLASFGNGWHGSGLQAELTAGYELPRASTLRTFVQFDAALPFYSVSAVRLPANYRLGVPLTREHRYAPSIGVSLGIGLQRNRRTRR